MLRPIPDQSFLAFGPPLAAAVAERYQVGASHWVINKWPKETVSSFAFESVCAKTMCEWFDATVAPAPFYDTKGKNTGITSLLSERKSIGLQLNDISTEQSSLESIFLNLVKESKDELDRG